MTMIETVLGPAVMPDRGREIQVEKTPMVPAEERASRVPGSGGRNDSKSGMPLPGVS